MTAEKLYAVTRPIKAHQVKFNKKKSVTILGFALMFCVVLNSHFTFTHSITDINASLRTALQELENFYLHQNMSYFIRRKKLSNNHANYIN